MERQEATVCGVPQGLRTNQGDGLVLVFILKSCVWGKPSFLDKLQGFPGTIPHLKLKIHCLRNALGLRQSGMVGQPSTNESLYTYIQILKKYGSS